MAHKKHIEKIEKIKNDMLGVYPPKTARKRQKQFVVNQPQAEPRQEIQANVRTLPGIITQRGCTYAGCKGVVLGPTRDILNLTHGPIGCGFYSWLTRRNQTRPSDDKDDNFMPYCFSTDMQDENVIFGGEKKLRKALEEEPQLFEWWAEDRSDREPGQAGKESHGPGDGQHQTKERRHALTALEAQPDRKQMAEKRAGSRDNRDAGTEIEMF